MRSVNRVMLIGRLIENPTTTGKVTNFKVGVSYGNKNDVHNVIVKGKRAEKCKNSLIKGRLIYAEGGIDKNKNLIASDIRFLESNIKKEK